MRDLISFLDNNDPNEPDFAKMLAEEGKVREVCTGQDGDPLNADEISAIKVKRD